MKWISWLCSAGSLIIVIGWVGVAVAGIVPDSSLPQPSRVRATRNRTVITAGTQRGENLFHSFRQFSVAPGQTASFQGIDSRITNLLVRVTGRSLSRIDGVIEALQSNDQISGANLFLINPNGIILGERASLRLGGSFIATTANRINFADGTQFSATNPQTSPLLTVSVPVGLQFGDRPGQIVNRAAIVFSDGSESAIGSNQDIAHTFALVGGDVTLDRGSRITTNGGRVEIGSVAAGEVSLTPVEQGWGLSYEGVQNFGDIEFLDSAQVDTSGTAAGAIQVQGRRVAFQEPFASLISYTSTQPGGAVEVIATDAIEIRGIQSGVTTYTEGSGRAGDIDLSTQRLILQEGGKVGSSTFSSGRAGNVSVDAAESITVASISQDPSSRAGDQLSILYAQTYSTGAAGNLRLETNRLQVRSGGQISANTFSSGDAGNITIRALDIELVGVALDANDQPILFRSLPVAGGLFVGTALDSTGDGGDLNIETQRLSLRGGAVLQATTYGQGDAGNVNIRATESIEVSGTSMPGNFPSRIVASSGSSPVGTLLAQQATGRGGNLNLATQTLIVQDDGAIAVNSPNPDSAGAGTIEIEANRVLLDNRGQLNAQTESGNAAKIQLTGLDLLVLRRNSDISTAAGLNSGGGSGGDIQIESDFILATPTEDSNIAADAGKGDGGNIQIEARGILGIAERTQPTDQSDITASSESGVAGEISISTPTIDPTQGLIELPANVIDASRLIAQGCRTGRQVADTLGEFVITGRGGLPPNPNDLRSSDAVITDWAVAPIPTEGASQTPLPTYDATDQPLLVEAQGWIRGEDGKVELVAQATQATPAAPGWTFSECGSQTDS